MTLVDSNIILDIVTDDPIWADWSQFNLDRAALAGPLVINDIIYAELSARYQTFEELDALLRDMGIVLQPMPRRALFAAATAFRQYRASGGTRTGVLPDFFIGAHAAVSDYPLLTRDGRRSQTYFPTVRLIVPGSA
ncbi:MAG TPA: type II toxin-antitoxin system VapC family toxin [Rhodopila sp.]|nr:type II toxin-antitoxin system VapC family toxin [Rhodopila sp.]